MSKHWSLVLSGVMLAALVIAGLSPGAREEDPLLPRAAFKGKAIIVTLRAESIGSLVLVNVRIRLLGHREFVVGKVVGNVDNAKDKRKGALLWLPIEDITQVAEYADLEELKKATNFSDE